MQRFCEAVGRVFAIGDGISSKLANKVLLWGVGTCEEIFGRDLAAQTIRFSARNMLCVANIQLHTIESISCSGFI